jgi:hypothetical protein
MAAKCDRREQDHYQHVLLKMTLAEFNWHLSRGRGHAREDCPECGGTLRPIELAPMYECADCGEVVSLGGTIA